MTEDNILSLSLPLLHESHLKVLIEGSTETWTYAILWRCSSSNRSLLNFEDGHYNPKASSFKCLPKQLRILGSSFTVSVTDEGVVSDEEWFFKISMTQSFGNTEDLPGHAFFNSSPVWVTGTDQLLASSTWQRTKWGHHFGIRTFVAIPSVDGVLELGSTDLIFCNTSRLDTLFGFLVRTQLLGHLPLHRLREQIRVQSSNAENWLERTENEITNCGHDREKNSLRQFQCSLSLSLSSPSLLPLSPRAHDEPGHSSYMAGRGKEKISDLKWSWPLLTDSSGQSTDRTSYSRSHDYSGPSRISYSVHNM